MLTAAGSQCLSLLSTVTQKSESQELFVRERERFLWAADTRRMGSPMQPALHFRLGDCERGDKARGGLNTTYERPPRERADTLGWCWTCQPRSLPPSRQMTACCSYGPWATTLTTFVPATDLGRVDYPPTDKWKSTSSVPRGYMCSLGS